MGKKIDHTLIKLHFHANLYIGILVQYLFVHKKQWVKIRMCETKQKAALSGDITGSEKGTQITSDTRVL